MNILRFLHIHRIQIIALCILTISAFGNAVQAATPFASPGVTFSHDLRMGDRGEEVLRLQQALNSNEDTAVALSGPGSSGLETEYFGPATLNAVIRLQEKYAAHILTPIGLTRGTGFVGEKTRTILNGMITEGTTPAPSSSPIQEPRAASTLPVIKEISPSFGPNGTKITIRGENFDALNTVLTSFNTLSSIPSNDGRTIEFTFDNPAFKELQKIRNSTNNIEDMNIPFYISVVTQSGTTSPAVFTVQIKKR